MFYTHPWEFDPDQPKMSGLKRGTRFRHYVGLKRTEERLTQMLSECQFGTMSDVLAASSEKDKKAASCERRVARKKIQARSASKWTQDNLEH